MIDIMSLREGYQRRIVSEIWRIEGSDNPADAMTKGNTNNALTKLLDTNRIDLTPIGWVTRDSATH